MVTRVTGDPERGFTLRLNDESGTGWDTAMLHTALGYCYEVAGDWDDAGRRRVATRAYR